MRLFVAAMLPTLAAPAFASDLDRAATSLIADLGLERLDGFDLGAGIALAVATDRSDVDRTLGDLLLGRVMSLGARELILIEAGGDGDARARAAGAEYLIAVRGAREGADMVLAAEVRSIDRGLWEPAGNVPVLATARGRFSVGTAVPEPPAKVEEKGARLVGPPIPLLSVAEPVLALAACPITLATDDDLILLTAKAVTVYTVDDRSLDTPRSNSLRTIGRFELADLDGSERASRDPIGAIACFEPTGQRALGVGHSGLGRGRILRAGRASRGIALEMTGVLPAIPLSLVSADRWLLAESVDRTNRIRVSVDGVLSPLLYDAARVGDRTLGVTLDYRVIELGPRLEEKAVLGSSGVGISGFSVDGQLYVVTTDNRPGDTDEITLLSNIGERRRETNPVPIAQGRVFATAVGRFFASRRSIVVAARDDSGSTEILAIAIEERAR